MGKASKPINLNDLAKEVTLDEGLKESVSIAQVKEVLRLTLKALRRHPKYRIMDLVKPARR